MIYYFILNDMISENTKLIVYIRKWLGNSLRIVYKFISIRYTFSKWVNEIRAYIDLLTYWSSYCVLSVLEGFSFFVLSAKFNLMRLFLSIDVIYPCM